MITRFARPARWAALVLVLLLALGAGVALVGGRGRSDEAASTPSEPAAADEARRPTEAQKLLTKEVAGGKPAGPPVPVPEPSHQDLALRHGRDVMSAPDSSGSGSAPASSPVGPGSVGGLLPPEAVVKGNPKVVKTAVLTVEVTKGSLDKTYKAAIEALSRAGGWVQSSETGSDQATLVLEVPVDRVESVLQGMRGLGKVRSESIAGEDVSAEYVDLEARLTHWRAQEAVFLGLMGKAKTIPETVQIQQQLSVVQQQIEQLEGRRRYLEGQTAFSTVRLSILEPGAVAKEPAGEANASTLGRAWERATGAALAVIGGILVVLGAAVPLALVLGIPGLVLMALRRRARSGAAVAPTAP